MPVVWNGVEFREQVRDSPLFTIKPNGQSEMTMRGWFDWEEIENQDASKAFIGFATKGAIWDGNAVKYVSRSPSASNPGAAGMNPYAHPKWPNGWFLCDGFGGVKGHVPQGVTPDMTADFDRGLCGLSFMQTVGGYRVLSDDAVVTTGGTPVAGGAFSGPDAPAEFFLLRNVEVSEKDVSYRQSYQGLNGLRWASDNTPVSMTGFFVIHEVAIELNWYPVPINCYNDAAITALIGKTNLRQFPLDSGGAYTPFMTPRADKSLVFGTPSKTIIRMGDGNYAYKVTFRLQWHPAGANFWFRTAGLPVGVSPRYEEVRRPGGAPLYETAEYSLAFMPP